MALGPRSFNPWLLGDWPDRRTRREKTLALGVLKSSEGTGLWSRFDNR